MQDDTCRHSCDCVGPMLPSWVKLGSKMGLIHTIKGPECRIQPHLAMRSQCNKSSQSSHRCCRTTEMVVVALRLTLASILLLTETEHLTFSSSWSIENLSHSFCRSQLRSHICDVWQPTCKWDLISRQKTQGSLQKYKVVTFLQPGATCVRTCGGDSPQVINDTRLHQSQSGCFYMNRTWSSYFLL